MYPQKTLLAKLESIPSCEKNKCNFCCCASKICWEKNKCNSFAVEEKYNWKYSVSFRISDPLIELSVNVLLVQICIPYAMEHFQPRATIKSMLRHWFTAVGWALGLTDFLLPRPDENNNNNNNNNGVQDNWNNNNNNRVGRRDIGVMVNMDARDHDIDDLALNNEIDEESDIDEQADNEYVSDLLLLLLLSLSLSSLLVLLFLSLLSFTLGS